MTATSNIVNVTVSRQTATVSRTTFGVPAIIGQFATSKTSPSFTRARYYASLATMAADGWAVGDAVYDAAALVFGQAQKPARIMVGRIDSADATIAASLDAIQLETADWYGFGLVGITSVKMSLSTPLTAGNVIASSIDGVAVAPVAYLTSHVNTMGLWKTAIEAAITGATATVSGNDITVVLAGRDLSPATVAVSGGTAVTGTVSYIADPTKTLGAAAWAASNGAKLFGHADADASILTSGTSDLPYQLKALSNGRAFSIYHAKPEEYAQFAWMGLELAKVPGKSTWAEKVLAGVTADNLTEAATTNAWGKNCSTFTAIGGANVAVFGVLANGEPVETVRGIDYATSEIQADLWSLKLNNDKVPYNDAGIVLEEGTLRGTGARMEAAGVFVPGSFEVQAPKFADVSTEDIAARTLRMGFTARIQNAIVKTDVAGVVTL